MHKGVWTGLAPPPRLEVGVLNLKPCIMGTRIFYFIFCFQISRLYSALKIICDVYGFFFFIEAHARHRLHPMLRCILKGLLVTDVFLPLFDCPNLLSYGLPCLDMAMEKESRCCYGIHPKPSSPVLPRSAWTARQLDKAGARGVSPGRDQ